MNYYLVEIKGKNPKRLLTKIFKLNINIFDIKYYYNKITFKTFYDDYLKILKIKTIYEINIIDIKGIKRIKILIKKYFIFLIFFIFSLLLLIYFTNHIYFININTNNNELKTLIKKELSNNNLTIYSKKLSYKELDKVSKSIKNNNIDSIEWISIYYEGVYLNIDVIERIKDKEIVSNELYDVVAAKNGYIMDIYAESGELLKVKEDYVKKGDVIISGNIFRNNKVVGKVSAKGDVYAEVWYNVKLNKSLKQIEKEKTSTGYKTLSINIFNKDINLIKIKTKIKKENIINIYNNKILNLKLTNSYIYDEKIINLKDEEVIKELEIKAKEEIEKNLTDKEYIIYQKTLKNYIEDDKIYIEVFFKVYENISEYKKIQEITEEE